ncbi:DUF1273 domain-containing protein [Lapidilactobacillus mulanensis]|uniref:UPF0398 protein ACFQ4L_09185 n=1 Tax=Lapidilactobacillus mulanensis TaxID=2485999 RepID=A0ABW4DQX5_9LACO|nr:DUF1273 domain-containing protein [Lapidilactobacillus mulanensis]
MLRRLWLTGYRGYELNVYQDDDPKLKVIKYSLKNALRVYLEDGLEWVITGAQLGVEQWGVEVATELKADFPELKVAVMLPFDQFGQQWNEKNQGKLTQILAQADFTSKVSNHPYQNPSQLKNYQTFMGEHTDGALLIYDPESPGKPKYDYEFLQQKTERDPKYQLQLIDFYELQDDAENLNEQLKNEEE